MELRKIYIIWLVISVLSLVNCVDVEYQWSETVREHHFESESESDSFRSGVKVLKDKFYSDKLDLVIVLDTQPGMEDFYKKNIFGPDFLNQLNEFDWRLAYTNTSINPVFFENLNDSESKGKKECSKWGAVGTSVLGIVLQSPFLATGGINSLSECVRSNKKGKEKKSGKYTNGDFLLFEHNGKKMEDINYLTKKIENHNEIFDHTMRFNPKKKKFLSSRSHENNQSNYNAPEIQKGASYPFTASLFSLSKNLNQEQESIFFRKDSQIIYIVVTPKDAAQDAIKNIDLKSFKEGFSDSFDNKNQFHLIPVGIKSADFVCGSKFTGMVAESQPAVNLDKISRQLDQKLISICSSHLSEDLIKQITKHLYSSEIL